MHVVSRGALIAATVSLAAGLLSAPSAAYAAEAAESLSAAEMAAALKEVTAASAKAAAGGWKATVNVTEEKLTVSELFVADPAAGVAFERVTFDGRKLEQYLAAGRGIYTSLMDPMSRAAVKMMRRSSVRYVFTPDRSVKLDDDFGGGGVSPSTLLTGDADRPGTRTWHDDGSADYTVSQDDATMTVHVTAGGVVASAHATGEGLKATLTYAYGPQQVKLPSSAATIGSAALNQGIAYLDMAATVKQVAGQAATDALRAARGRTVSVSSLRKAAQRDAKAANAAFDVSVVRTRAIGGGVRVYATNPWTKRTVAYTLKATGRKVVIAKK